MFTTVLWRLLPAYQPQILCEFARMRQGLCQKRYSKNKCILSYVVGCSWQFSQFKITFESSCANTMNWMWWERANVTWAGTAVCQRVKYTNSSRTCAVRYGAATRNAPTNACSTWNQIWTIHRLLINLNTFLNTLTQIFKTFSIQRAAST